MKTSMVGCKLVTTTLCWVAVLFVVGSWSVCPTLVSAQVSTATINGVVRDPSSASIVNAEVTLRSLETGITHTTQTNSAGNYVLLSIPPGHYTLEVAKEGFKTAQQEAVTLEVNETATFDFTLQLGTATETVAVNATGADIEVSTAGLGNVINSEEVSNLPLNGRNFTQLLTLSPGASPIAVSQSSGGFMTNPIGKFAFPAINGQSNRSNMYLLDGVIDLGGYVDTYAVAPVIDAVQEFKVQSHDLAEIGGVTGGTVNIVTKSGTNEFHGSLWEFLRNNVFDARSPLLTKVTPFKQNEFGAAVGGPVIRNKTFFFADYEGFRLHTLANALSLVPTADQLGGDFTGLPQIYDPLSTRPDPNNPGSFIRDPFVCDASGNPLGSGVAGTPCNKVPADRLDPHMVGWAQAVYPAAAVTGIPGVNHINTSPSSVSQDVWSFRIDHHLTARDDVSFRYSRTNQDRTSPSAIATAFLPTSVVAHNWGVNYVHTFGSSSILQAQFGRNYANTFNGSGTYPGLNAMTVDNTIGLNANTACGFANLKTGVNSPSYCIIPGVTILGISGTPDTGTLQLVMSDMWQGRATFSKIVGNHTFKVGGEASTNNGSPGVSTRDVMGFAPQQTGDPEIPGTGVGLASFLLNVPDNGNYRNTIEGIYSGWVNGAFFQDTWKITPKLTVNWGLRWDVTVMPRYGSTKIGNNAVGDTDLIGGKYILLRDPGSCADVGAAPCIPGGLQNPAFVIDGQPRVVVAPDGRYLHNSYDNWGPRLGLSYRLTNNTVIRSSFGLFYDNWSGITQIARNVQSVWPSVTAKTVGSLNTPTQANPLPTTNAQDLFGFGTGAVLLPGPTPFNQVYFAADPRFKVPYSEQWNFGIQRQLTPTTVLDVNYAGSHNSRLDIGGYYNTAPTPGPGNPQDRSAFPFLAPTNFDRSWGRSSYNALQVRLDRRFNDGLSYLVSYTWSRSFDIGCDGAFGVEGCDIQNPYDMIKDRGPSGFDLPQMLVTSAIYKLPFGAGAKFKTGNRAVDYIVGPWQTNAILMLTSGQVYSVGIAGDIANTGNSNIYDAWGGYERLNVIGNPSLSNPTRAEWFNTAAFAPPAPFTFGTSGRNSLRGDGFVNLDFSVFRQFPIMESKMVEFRFEMFNATNTPTWGLPNPSWNSVNFGKVLSTRSSPRQLQLGLKFAF